MEGWHKEGKIGLVELGPENGNYTDLGNARVENLIWESNYNDVLKVLIKKPGKKITVSDIAKMADMDKDTALIVCEVLYKDEKIQFAGNSRYYIEESGTSSPKSESTQKSEEVDVEKELEKLKGLLDKGLITQEQYDAKSNELLGL